MNELSLFSGQIQIGKIMMVKSGKLNTTPSHSEDPSLTPLDQEDTSSFPLRNLHLDLDDNLLLLEYEAAFFQFALKEIHDLTS